MRRLIAVLSLWAAPLAAEDFVTLEGAAIRALLEEARVDYGTAWQEFRKSGRTLYNAGQDTWGYWQVQGDLYCSQWPPRSEWACYSVAQSGSKVRFIGGGDDVTEGVLSK